MMITSQLVEDTMVAIDSVRYRAEQAFKEGDKNTAFRLGGDAIALHMVLFDELKSLMEAAKAYKEAA